MFTWPGSYPTATTRLTYRTTHRGFKGGQKSKKKFENSFTHIYFIILSLILNGNSSEFKNAWCMFRLFFSHHVNCRELAENQALSWKRRNAKKNKKTYSFWASWTKLILLVNFCTNCCHCASSSSSLRKPRMEYPSSGLPIFIERFWFSFSSAEITFSLRVETTLLYKWYISFLSIGPGSVPSMTTAPPGGNFPRDILEISGTFRSFWCAAFRLVEVWGAINVECDGKGSASKLFLE